MKTKTLLSVITLVFNITNLSAQVQFRTDGTIEIPAQTMNQSPDEKERKAASEKITQDWISNHRNYRVQNIITIPVVVHVIWNTAAQNISDAQIQSQMNVLNKDFRKQNVDTLSPSHPFAQFAGDAQIEFCLAQQDSAGNSTNGITRTYTSKAGFNYLDSIWSSAAGGEDGWDPHRYLNIWTFYASGGIIGWGTSPSALLNSPAADGIYVADTAFGTIGALEPSFNKGRTATQVIGSWLNLLHIWGDDGGLCSGSDSVSDTPKQAGPTYGCPSFPLLDSCTSTGNGIMFMNFMDYTDDSCMSLFTNGQVTRMQATLNTARASLLTSQGCIEGIADVRKSLDVKLFPNPSSGNFSLRINYSQKTKIEIDDVLGKVIYQTVITETQHVFNLSDKPTGIYFVKVANEEGSWVGKFVKE